MSTVFEGIGDRVRRLRKAAGQTQEEFAETIGVSLRSLKGYETGARELPTSAILKLCELSSVSPSWIIFGRRDSLDADTLELLQRSIIPGLELLRSKSSEASSAVWADYLAALMKVSFAQGVPISGADAEKIMGFRSKL